MEVKQPQIQCPILGHHTQCISHLILNNKNPNQSQLVCPKCLIQNQQTSSQKNFSIIDINDLFSQSENEINHIWPPLNLIHPNLQTLSDQLYHGKDQTIQQINQTFTDFKQKFLQKLDNLQQNIQQNFEQTYQQNLTNLQNIQNKLNQTYPLDTLKQLLSQTEKDLNSLNSSLQQYMQQEITSLQSIQNHIQKIRTSNLDYKKDCISLIKNNSLQIELPTLYTFPLAPTIKNHPLEIYTTHNQIKQEELDDKNQTVFNFYPTNDYKRLRSPLFSKSQTITFNFQYNLKRIDGKYHGLYFGLINQDFTIPKYCLWEHCQNCLKITDNKLESKYPFKYPKNFHMKNLCNQINNVQVKINVEKNKFIITFADQNNSNKYQFKNNYVFKESPEQTQYRLVLEIFQNNEPAQIIQIY